MNHIARSHVRNGSRVSWNTVPAVSDVSPSHALASKHTARHYPRLLDSPTMTAKKSIGPAQATNMVAATILAAKPVVHFFERSRVINTRTQLAIFHAAKISALITGIKGIPICPDLCRTTSRRAMPRLSRRLSIDATRTWFQTVHGGRMQELTIVGSNFRCRLRTDYPQTSHASRIVAA